MLKSLISPIPPKIPGKISFLCNLLQVDLGPIPTDKKISKILPMIFLENYLKLSGMLQSSEHNLIKSVPQESFFSNNSKDLTNLLKESKTL